MFRRLHNDDTYEESISIVMPERSKKSHCTASRAKTIWAAVCTILCIVFIIALAVVVHSHIRTNLTCAPVQCSNQQTEAITTIKTTAKYTNTTTDATTPTPTISTVTPMNNNATTEVHSSADPSTAAPIPSIYDSEEWTIATGLILSRMNTSAEPCDDFYQYACGGFLANSFLPPTRTTVSRFSDLRDRNKRVLLQGLTKKSDSLYSVSSDALNKSQAFYKLCTDMIRIQNQGFAPLQKALTDMGKWDRFMDENLTELSKEWNFTKELTNLHQYAIMPLVYISVYVDDKNSSLYTLKFDSSGLSLPSEKSYNSTYGKSESEKSAFVGYGSEVLRLLGWENATSAHEKMMSIYEFEKKLAEIYVPREEWRNISQSYHKLLISDLLPGFSQTLDLLAVTRDLPGSKVNHVTECVTYVKSYFEKLPELLKEYINTSHSKVLDDYMTWRFIHTTVSYLGPNFQYAQLELDEATDGVEGLPDRWVNCVGQADDLMDMVTGAIFIEADDSDQGQRKTQVKEIVKGVIDTLNDRFDRKYDWMDTETKAAAKEKLKAIKPYLVYPDYLTNTTSIDQWYEDLVIDDNSFFITKLNGRRWILQRNLDKFGSTPNSAIWSMSIPSVNAYYSPPFNSINIPTGILRNPFFDPKLPRAWNYGGIGAVVGHEISHAFDDQGSKYDKDGNLNANWWSQESMRNFSELAECIVKQYKGYSINGQPLNSKLTEGEDIADNGGLSLAHEAYINSTDASAFKIPGLDLSSDQLFFLSYSQTWCAVTTPEALFKSINLNSHSPPEFRVRGPLSNFKPFADAFKCPADSRYKSADPCTVW